MKNSKKSQHNPKRNPRNKTVGPTSNRKFQTGERRKSGEDNPDKRNSTAKRNFGNSGASEKSGINKSYRKSFNREDRREDSRDKKSYSDDRRIYRKEDESTGNITHRKNNPTAKKRFDSNTDIKLRKKRFDKSVPQNKHAKTMHSPVPKGEETMRLNKYLANSGVAARRKCDEFIAAGVVKVNNEVITQMGYRVKQGDKVYFKGKLVEPVNFVYILLNKPKDYITTADDERGRSTVLELVQHATEERVYPVGRLDRNTTGLLLLTNDGDLAQKLSHPKYGATKLYEVELDKPLSHKDLVQIENGVELEDGIAQVDGIDYAHHTKKNILGISIHIGKNRIVRRIFEHLGYKVMRLDRTMYAGLTKKDLPRGKWRMLTEKEIIKLKYLK